MVFYFYFYIVLYRKCLSTQLFLPIFCRLSDPSQYQSIVDAEWNIIYDKLAKCVESGAKVVLSRLAIGDLGTQVSIVPFLNAFILLSVLPAIPLISVVVIFSGGYLLYTSCPVY